MQDELVVTLEAADIAEAYRSVVRWTRLRILALILALMLAALLVALLVRFPELRAGLADDPLAMGLIGAMTLVLVAIVALLATAPAVRAHVGRSTLADHPGMRDPIRYTFYEEQFAVEATYTKARYPSELLWSWRETGSVIIVLPTPRNFYVIPKRGADPALLDRLRANLGRARATERR